VKLSYVNVNLSAREVYGIGSWKRLNNEYTKSYVWGLWDRSVEEIEQWEHIFSMILYIIVKGFIRICQDHELIKLYYIIFSFPSDLTIHLIL